MILLRGLTWLALLPLQLLLLGTAALLDAAHALKVRLRPDPSPAGGPSRDPRLCTVVVLNWNGRHLLEESLPALERAAAATGEPHQILVVDNGSSDDSLQWLEREFPAVEVLALDQNLGFGEGNNRGVEAARHDIVVLLNNDMIVEENFLAPLLEVFSDPGVFAVSSQIFFPAGKRREETGNTSLRFRWGYPELSHDPVRPCHLSRRALPVLWAGGGSSAFDRRRFLELGGFSSIFSPAYFEDTDLSYRAWRRGWKVLLAAHSKVLHKHRSSSSTRFERTQLQNLVEERRLWYLWKNYPLSSLAGHFLLLPLHIPTRISGPGYIRSLRRLPSVLAARWREPRRRLPDARIHTWVRRPLSYLDRFHPHRRRSAGPLRILVVSAYLPRLGSHGGGGRVFQFLTRVAQKHRVSVISFVESEEEAQAADILRPHCQRLELVRRGVSEPVSFYPYEPYEEFRTAAFRQRLERVLSEEDFDLVHFEWTQMAQYARLFPHTPKLLTEIEVHYAAEQTRVRLEKNPLRRLYGTYRSLQTFYREIEMCRRVDRVICVTDKDRDFLGGYLEDRQLEVINTGVDVSFFTPNGQPPQSNALVFVGAFRHHPNIDAMHFFTREVFPRVLEEHPDTHLYIVGSAPPREIRELASASVTVTGFVEDIRDYYGRAQVVVVPLRTGVGIRGKILEGWAAGKAMVATSLACLGIAAEHGENIMIADDAAEFAFWTSALLNDAAYCRRMGQRGRRVAVERYDWGSLGSQLSRLYEDTARP